MKVMPDDFEFIHLPLVREYLSLDFKDKPMERIINDFCAFGVLTLAAQH
jgi:hypothetical protein